MKTVVGVVFAFVSAFAWVCAFVLAGCAAPPADGGAISLPVGDGDGKADGFWSEVKMLGDLGYDTPVPVDVDYSLTPQYRGFRLDGTFDDLLDVTVRSDGTGRPSLMLYDANKKLIASNYAPYGSTPLDAHVSVPLAADGTVYVVLFEMNDHAAHFVVTATHKPVCHPALCTSDQCGINIPDGCGGLEACGECLPTTTDPLCASFGMDCGRIYPPGHGAGVECGGCRGGASCGGAGVAGVCAATVGPRWLEDLPRLPSGAISGKATFTLVGVADSGTVNGVAHPTGTITCGVSGILGDGLPSLYCNGPHSGGWVSVRSDGSFAHDNRDFPGADQLVVAGAIEPHARIRITKYSEVYLSPTNATHEWAFPCMLYRDPIACVSGASSWTASATATLK